MSIQKISVTKYCHNISARYYIFIKLLVVPFSLNVNIITLVACTENADQLNRTGLSSDKQIFTHFENVVPNFGHMVYYI